MNTAPTDGFRVDVHQGIAVVTIDRPKANAIDAATSVAMGEVFAAFEADPAVRVAIVTGAGDRFFSAGWDLSAAGDGESFDSDYGVGGFGGFVDLPERTVPVIAAVNGMAVGGGFEIAMEATLGMLPDAGSVRLPQILPPHLARELLLTGRRMGATEAHDRGLVNRVVPGAELLGAAHDLAHGVRASAPLSVAAILDIGRRSAHLDPVAAMASLRSLASYRAAIDSEDAAEGLAARAEGRSPEWKGR
jgi:crotonobetainyl-CoA hydratase